MKQLRLAILFLSIMSPPIHAEQAKCADHMQLANASIEELEDLVPCDMLGISYMTGLGVLPQNTSGLNNRGDSDEFAYYPLFRRFMQTANHESDPSRREAIGFLILGLAALPQLKNHEVPESRRENYYASYAIIKHAQGDHGDLGELVQLFEEALREWLENSAFSNTAQVVCFVEHDIPTLPIEAVLNSDRYSLCLGGS